MLIIWEQTYHIRPVLSEHPSIFATELLLPTRVSTTTESTNVTDHYTETPQKSVQKSAQKSAQKIVLLIKDNADITTQEIDDILGVNRSGVARHIKKLQEQGIIRRVGPDKGGHWEITDK